MKSSIFYLGFFAWAPLAVALYGGYLAYGLPHVIWAYEWREINSNAQRHYLTCTHLGPYGAFKLPARAGKCGLIIFIRPQAGKPATAFSQSRQSEAALALARMVANIKARPHEA